MRLRRSHPERPGFSRRRRGRGFSYLDSENRPIKDTDVVERICLDAVLDARVVQVDDLLTDLRRPSYGPRAAKELGIGSQLAFQFRAEPHARGGLNLYSCRPGDITTETRQIGVMFADPAAVALGWSRQDETMTEALGSRTVIGRAVGILMERYRLDPDRAFEFLVRTSQTGNIKLRDVAAGIVDDTVTRAC